MSSICIYPNDPTTLFLEPICKALEVTGQCTILRPEIQANYNDIIQIIKDSEDGTLIIFLGHGTTFSLNDSNQNPIICNEDFYIFKHKRLFFLSCRSREFISANETTPIQEYIGFGNMLTDWDEIFQERNNDANAYPNITKEIILQYRELLTKAICADIKDLIISGKDMKYFYIQLRMRLNRSISELLLNKEKGYLETAYMLDETKKEIKLVFSKGN